MDHRSFRVLVRRVCPGLGLCNMTVMYFACNGWNLVAWMWNVKLLPVTLWSMMNGLNIWLILCHCMTYVTLVAWLHLTGRPCLNAGGE
jgi:hypothetical protein